ncbi:uncharacterized protein LTR77_007663 [Saxophila tyrrhenica]|uniref:Uncharacterized protein n=1 Tax=Saxophila tyrrhenica TaxID=1690608 RepID=A0AAV9P2Q3_9PEZI|nr:hypothetical protein LTR77_007663 [Saxophila tyrrhenica]
MLDENLPAFILKPSSTGVKHHRDFYLAQHGNDPVPSYSLQHADPASPSPAHKNCYGAALFDAYNPEVLFGEVLARPGWTQPTLSAEEARRQGGVAPPPQPIIPTEFAVQLYEPDQQIRVSIKSSTFGSDSYEFSLPETAFRTPSSSTLDHGQSDPASLNITPRINFVWRKESKLNKDLTCYMTGKSTDVKSKKSKRDPDIAIALWRSMRELTIYEPNLARIGLEDPKGLEVTLLLSAVVIRDLYFSSKDQLPELFNISDMGARKLSSGGRKLSNPRTAQAAAVPPNALHSQPPKNSVPQQTPNEAKRTSLPRLQTTPPHSRQPSNQPPPMADLRAQWELDAETARLKAEQRAEQEAEARAAAARRKQREREDEAERRRLQRMVDEEAKAAQKKQVEIDRETDRLRKLYGVKPLPNSQQQPQRPPANSSSSRTSARPPQMPARPTMGSNGLYTQPSASSSSVMMSGANNSSSLGVPSQRPAKKKSFFGLRSASDDGAQAERLRKKGSAMW